MSQPNIAKYYDNIVEHLSLLWIFLEKECTLLWELPFLGALQFRLISERLFACIASPDMWGKTGGRGINLYWLEDQWGSHTYGNPNYRWGRGRKYGYGDHLLLPWSSQNGGLWCTLCPTSMGLTGAKCGCSEKIHQHPMYPSKDILFLLSRCEHLLLGCFLCPVTTEMVVSMQGTPFLWGQGDHQEGEVGLKVYPLS